MYKKWLSVLAVMGSFLLNGSVCAASVTDDLSKLLNSLHTMQADFTQAVSDNHGKVIQKSYGRMAFERPGKFRWQVTKPIPQLIVANGAKLWIYDPDLAQVTIRSLKRAVGETPALLLSHEDSNLNGEFNISEKTNGSANDRTFILVPRQKDSLFASIQMKFVNGRIDQMRLADHLGHATMIQFANAKTNTTLAAQLFIFKAAANIDVINETNKK